MLLLLGLVSPLLSKFPVPIILVVCKSRAGDFLSHALLPSTWPERRQHRERRRFRSVSGPLPILLRWGLRQTAQIVNTDSPKFSDAVRTRPSRKVSCFFCHRVQV